MRYIYALKDPETLEIRYIGQTIDTENRLKAHLRKSFRPKLHSQCWIKSLRNRNLKPLMKILLVTEDSEWEYYETKLIAYYPNLTNKTKGGTSSWWSSLSETEKEKFKNKPKKPRILSPEGRENIRKRAIETHKGRKRSEKTKEKISLKMRGQNNHRYGKTISEETREKIRKSAINRKQPQETIEKLKVLNTRITGKKISQYTLNGEFISIFPSINEASRLTGIHRSNISACCSGRLKKSGGFFWKFT